jgi:AraC-like DNA-binding protein
MEGFESVISGLFCDDIVEFVNLPHVDSFPKLSSYKRFRVRYDNEDEAGYELIYHIRDGLVLRFFDLQMRRDNQMPFMYEAGYFSFYFTLSGQHMTLKGEGEDFLNTENLCAINYHSEQTTCQDFSKANVRYCVVNIVIKKSLLEAEFFDHIEENAPEILQPIFSEAETSLSHTLAVGVDIRQALQMLLKSNHSGIIRDRFMEAKVTELICLLMTALKQEEQTSDSREVGVRETALLEQVRSSLVEDLSSPPSIDELARRVGIGKANLLELFKQIYGMTLRNYLLQERMESAKTLLLDRSLNINEVGWQLGYEYACNFTTAFKDYYGLTPNAYRKIASAK